MTTQTGGFIRLSDFLAIALAARKDIRDNFDSKIADYTKTVSDLLKQPYKLEVNFNQFYAYAAASEDASWVKSSPGQCAASYFESFISNLKRFTDDVGTPAIPLQSLILI